MQAAVAKIERVQHFGEGEGIAATDVSTVTFKNAITRSLNRALRSKENNDKE